MPTDIAAEIESLHQLTTSELAEQTAAAISVMDERGVKKAAPCHP